MHGWERSGHYGFWGVELVEFVRLRWVQSLDYILNEGWFMTGVKRDGLGSDCTESQKLGRWVLIMVWSQVIEQRKQKMVF